MTSRHRSPVVVPSDAPETADVVRNVSGNYYNKHEASNPVIRWIMDRFHNRLLDEVRSFSPAIVLDAGCGEGRTSWRVHELGIEVVGLELERSALREAPRGVETMSFVQGSVYSLPFSDSTFDVVICTEVLEHLDNPAGALEELIRVARRGVVVTVPREPWWRLANLARGSYVRDLGNTPGHVQHFTKRGLEKLVDTYPASRRVVGSSTMWRFARIKV